MNSLTKYEIACVTTGVPASDDPLINLIITQGLRFRAATEFVSHGKSIDEAVKLADELLNAFRTKTNG